MLKAEYTDAQRLDWMQENPSWTLTCRLHGRTQQRQWAMRDDGEPWGRWHSTNRAALDDAMRAAGVTAAPASDLMQQALDALVTARAAIEPLTGAQIRLHRIPVDTAVRIENAITALRTSGVRVPAEGQPE